MLRCVHAKARPTRDFSHLGMKGNFQFQDDAVLHLFDSLNGDAWASIIGL